MVSAPCYRRAHRGLEKRGHLSTFAERGKGPWNLDSQEGAPSATRQLGVGTRLKPPCHHKDPRLTQHGPVVEKLSS